MKTDIKCQLCLCIFVIAIGLRNCPSLKTPPVEIVGRGVEATKAFLRRLSGGTTENWRTKLMLVGLGGAGKTRYVVI